MINKERFNDDNKRIEDFNREVWLVCNDCKQKAIATVNHETRVAKITCTNCGYSKSLSTQFAKDAFIAMGADFFFPNELWLQHPFKDDLFYAYNYKHLLYLEQYISATLREHKNREHFTLLEKLPRFYHEAKNRQGLLKIIQKLKDKG